MSNEKRRGNRASIAISETMENALARLKGRRVGTVGRPGECDFSMRETVGGDMHNGTAHFMATFLEEAIYAAEEFADKHGYLPRQPRFDIVTDAGSDCPAPPRRWEKCRELAALESALKELGA